MEDKKLNLIYWLKKHADTGIVVGVILFALNFNVKKFDKIDDKFVKMNEKLSSMEKDITMIKTVLILNHMLPTELAKEEKK